MRITDRMIFEGARSSVAQARDAATAAQELVSSGTRIHHPGDDPVAAGMTVAFQMSSARLEAIAKTASAAAGELSAGDGALGDIGSSITRARELAVQFSSSVYTADNRLAGSKELTGLLNRVVAALNTQFGNRYIFGGSADQAAPFQADGTYQGNGDVRTVEVAPGIYQPANVRADVMMGVAGGGTNVMATLQALQAALAANDPSAVSATLRGLDASLAQVGAARGELGVNVNTLDTAATAAKNAATDAQRAASQQGGVDIAEAATQMQATQTALQATLAAAAQSFKASLLDYLR